jgi:3-oxoacyl-[acyl-carrier protein] reductase
MTKKIPEAAQKAFLDRIPLKRMGTPEEVADVAVFLASDVASYVSGTVVDVGGGQQWMTEDGRPAFRDAAPAASREA